jgi:hypothetical protein
VISKWPHLVSILLSVNFLACSDSQPAPSAPAPGAQDEQRIVDRSAEAVRRLRSNPEFSSLDRFLKDARGVLVFPRLVKASLDTCTACRDPKTMGYYAGECVAQNGP